MAVTITKKVVPEVLKLVEAQALYQLVKGSSSNTVYVTSALSRDGKTKLATKSKGADLSIRLEGEIPPNAVPKLAALGIQSKGTYYSGHYQCQQLPPERVLGAVLFSCGVEWGTPYPDFNKIVEGSK